jgi:starch-binding outer membrane protein, SusD/RagB family
MRHILQSGRVLFAAAVFATAAGIAGCSNLKDDLLEAPDPDIIDPSSVQSAAGANAVRIGALSRLRGLAAGTESTWLFGGLLADEWSTSSTFVQNDETDERSTSTSNSTVNGQLRTIYRARTSATQAIALLNKYRPSPVSDIAEMYMARGFAELQLALDFCNGIPLSVVDGEDITLGTPRSVDEVCNVAISSFDSAMAIATGTDTVAVSVVRASRVGKARALLGLDKVVEAGALVSAANVPTTYAYLTTYSLGGGNNIIWSQAASQRRYSVGDSLEGNARNILVKNAIPFFSSKDPRLPVVYSVSSKGDTTKSQDGLTYSRTTVMYGQTTAVALANGIDARLIEAEAAFRANNPALMITILNALRATAFKLGEVSYAANALPALADPGNDAARRTLLFREKAFWTFSRGQRLGDMRRLIRYYKLPQDQVFPVGTHYRGGTYGTDVNLPVTTDESNGNPNFKGCTDRNA